MSPFYASQSSVKSFKTRERQRAGIVSRVSRGEHYGCAPVGYRNSFHDGLKGIEADGIMAPLVRQSFEMVACGRKSLRVILREMTKRGLRSRNSRPMGVSAFWTMLTNPFYVGWITYQGKLYEGSHLPLIGLELFRAVQVRLMSQRRRGKDEILLNQIRNPSGKIRSG